MRNSFSNLFEFVSKKEAEKRRLKYINKMLPFGEDQRKLEIALLKDCMSSKLRDEERLYFFFCVKECLLQDDEDYDDAISFYRTGKFGSELPDRDWLVMKTLAELELGCTSLEDFPDADDILSRLQ